MRDRADAERLRRVVQRLCGEHSRRSSSNPAAVEAALGFIENEWRSRGFEPRVQSFEAGGRSWRNGLLRIDPDPAEAKPAGRGPVVVGAHYDVVDGSPGADDNASGVAGLLELASVLDGSALGVPVELAAYALEEPPYFRTDGMGSYAHARSLEEQGAEVRAMLALEMIGYFSEEPGSQRFPLYPFRWFYPSTADFIVVAGRWGQGTLVRSVRDAMDGATALNAESIVAPRLVSGIDFSDHYSFYRCGYPAAMVTDTAFYRNPHYHRPSDTPETLDYDRMAKVVDAVAAAVEELAA